MIQEHFFNKCFYFANRFSGEVKRHILRQKPSHKAPGSRPALTFWLFQIINARCNSTVAEPMWRLEDKAGLARVTLALGKEKAELLALLSILLPLTLGWETPMAGSHLRCIKQHWSSSLHCAAGDAGWQLWEGVCHVSLPHQQTGQGVVTLLPHLWGSWLADCKWVLLLAEGESSPHPQSTGDFSQDGRSHRTIIPVSDYINNLPIGFALRSITFPYCLQSEGSLGLQEVITSQINQVCAWLSCGAVPRQAAGFGISLGAHLSHPCASSARLLHPGTLWAQMAKALSLLESSWAVSELEMWNKGPVLLLIRELELSW